MSRIGHRRWQFSGRSRTPVGLLATIVGVVAMVVFGIVVAERGNDSVEASSAFGVYLQSTDPSIEDPIDVALVRQALEERRFGVVDDARALEDFIATEHPQSIWIHDSSLPSVSAEWLRTQLKNGTVIVAIDASSSELASVLKVDAGRTPDWNPPNASTFVVVGQALDVPFTNEAGESATKSRFTRGNDVFDPSNLRPLVAVVDRVIGNVRETYGGSR